MRDLRSIALPAYGPSILSAVGTGAVIPVIVLSARDLGAGLNLSAFMVALLGVGQLAGDLPAGALAARIGERATLVGACALEAVGMAGGALARNVPLLAASILVLGLSASTFGLARQAYLTDAVPIALRARALSTLGGVGRIGLFVGPFIGAAVVSRWGISAAYVVGLCSSASAFLLLLVVPDITAGHRAEQLLAADVRHRECRGAGADLPAHDGQPARRCGRGDGRCRSRRGRVDAGLGAALRPAFPSVTRPAAGTDRGLRPVGDREPPRGSGLRPQRYHQGVCPPG